MNEDENNLFLLSDCKVIRIHSNGQNIEKITKAEKNQKNYNFH